MTRPLRGGPGRVLHGVTLAMIALGWASCSDSPAPPADARPASDRTVVADQPLAGDLQPLVDHGPDGLDAAPDVDCIPSCEGIQCGDNGCGESCGECDDKMACTEDTCVAGRCITSPLFDCPWPAEQASLAVNLTGIEGPLINDFHKDLSGAVWDPLSQSLWVCRNTHDESKIWVIVGDGAGGFKIGEKAGQRGEWTGFNDAEGLSLADLSEPETLYLIVEGEEMIKEYDLSSYGVAVLNNSWETSPHLPTDGGLGAEGITFVPDQQLLAQGFVDAEGNPYVSALGMGGLMFVGHQNGGDIYVFDLNRQTGEFIFVGEYDTSADETAALEFDRASGQLYIWHGAEHNTLEVVRLSSTETKNKRRFETSVIFQGPDTVLFGSDNHEGLAVASVDECAGDQRSLFMTTDGGNFWSLLWYKQFPCF